MGSNDKEDTAEAFVDGCNDEMDEGNRDGLELELGSPDA